MAFENTSIVFEGGVLRVKSGGQIIIESGGIMDLKTGASITADTVQKSAIADVVMTVGTADGTLADVTGSHDQTILNNNFRDLGEKLNLVLAALRAAGIIAAS